MLCLTNTNGKGRSEYRYLFLYKVYMNFSIFKINILVCYSEIKINIKDLEYTKKQRFICYFSNSLQIIL